MHGPPGTSGGLEYKSARGDVKVEQIVASSYKSFLIAQSKPKLILVAVTAPLPGIDVLTEQSVATDHPAQIATSVIGIGGRHLRERASSHEFMRGGEVRPSWLAVTGSGYEPPAEIAEKPVIPARNELGAVFERCSEGGLDGAPVRKHSGFHISPI